MAEPEMWIRCRNPIHSSGGSNFQIIEGVPTMRICPDCLEPRDYPSRVPLLFDEMVERMLHKEWWREPRYAERQEEWLNTERPHMENLLRVALGVTE